VAIVHQVGQQPSPEVQAVTGRATQAALHVPRAPSSFTSVHTSPAGQVLGQAAWSAA
jgi:hypothetical protein